MKKFFACVAPKKKRDDKGKSPLEEARTWEQDIPNKVSYAFHQLSDATQSFNDRNLLGQGYYSKVYRGTIGGQIVAVKQLEWNNGSQDQDQKFKMEVMVLSELSHPNLVELIGYCSVAIKPLLVFEYMRGGSLDDHLFDINRRPLSWYQRMKIALDVARGLEYFHRGTRFQTIYRDLRCSNILLDEQYNAKLSDLGQARFTLAGVEAEHLPLSTSNRAFGYYAPECLYRLNLTAKSDIYSHGVVMLQFITGGRISLDGKILVEKARPMLGDEQRYKVDLVDTRLEGRYPKKDLDVIRALTARDEEFKTNSEAEELEWDSGLYPFG